MVVILAVHQVALMDRLGSDESLLLGPLKDFSCFKKEISPRQLRPQKASIPKFCGGSKIMREVFPTGNSQLLVPSVHYSNCLYVSLWTFRENLD